MKIGSGYQHLACALVLTVMTGSTVLAQTIYEFDSVQQEAQYQALIEDFRCPTCQNQNLASSDAPIAQDLKQKTYEMVKDGRTDAEIRAFMAERYGDSISYRPPVRPSTWVLWFFPPLLLVVLIGMWIMKSRRKQQNLRQTTTQSEHIPLSDHEQARLEAILGNNHTNEQSRQGDAS